MSSLAKQLQSVGADMLAAVKSFVGEKLEPLQRRLIVLEQKEIPAQLTESQIESIIKRLIPEPILPSDESMVALFAKMIPAPVKGEPGESPTDERLSALIAKQIPAPLMPSEESIMALLIKMIPAPIKGNDGETPSDERLSALIAKQIPAPLLPSQESITDLLVKMIPAPIKGDNGHTPTAEELTALITPLIPAPIVVPECSDDRLKAIAATVIKQPADGRTPTDDELTALIVKLIPDPVHGEAGRDAIDLEILPAIDPAKSYARGSYAKHDGGLWRSFERTHELRGWECIVNGVASVDFEQIDARSYRLNLVMSDGAIVSKTMTIPTIIDRGVFKADIKYTAGDATSWGGSLWIAQPLVEGKAYGRPGDIESGWRLSVKKGADGKDARS